MIQGFTPRLYQETIFATAARKNTLVVLPTGLGKTNIFLMLAAHRLQQFPSSKILLVGPTRPLIDQYLAVFKENFSGAHEEMAVLTGHVPPEKRAQLWNKSGIIFSTPQGLENDLLGGTLSLADVSLLGFDEAHRAVGEYAYVWLAKNYHATAKNPRIIALTASPGSDMETITQVCSNLYIEEIEMRDVTDADVRPYVQDMEIEWVKVELPQDLAEVQALLERCLSARLATARKYVNISARASKKELLRIQAQLHARISRQKSYPHFQALSIVAEIIKLQHALELLESQGITPLVKYLQKMRSEQKSKAVRNILSDPLFQAAQSRIEELFASNIEHPKIAELKRILSEEAKKPGFKAIVFAQYRDSTVKLSQELSTVARCKTFVGQLKKGETGLSQKEQKAVIEAFRAGEFDVLIATSIGEEGLDIPKVDLVVFYEPIPSAIRQIQRRGRTGRQEKGKVVVLMTKSTRDESYQWVAQGKEKRMHRALHELKKKFAGGAAAPARKEAAQALLTRYEEGNGRVKIFADTKEKNGAVLKELHENAELRLKSLAVGDYLCSSRVAVEVKTAEDFIASLLDGRLLQQASELKRSYERPVLILEGIRDLYTVRNVHENAIQGMLAALSVSYGIPILPSRNGKETAGLLMAIARREQGPGTPFSPHAAKKPKKSGEQQLFVVSSLPGVGEALAEPLLREFGSVQAVFSASEEELRRVPLIGEKKARAIREVLEKRFEKGNSLPANPAEKELLRA